MIMKKILFIIIALFSSLVLITACEDEETDGCDNLVYDGSYLNIDELSFCPAYLDVTFIQSYQHGYLEQRLISDFTTDYEMTTMPERAFDVQIIIRTPIPNVDTLQLPTEFTGTYADLKEAGFHMDIAIFEHTAGNEYYPVNVDSLASQLDIYFKTGNLEEFIGVELKGNVILSKTGKKVLWESEFRFMD
jgi:hypothetical protein